MLDIGLDVQDAGLSTEEQPLRRDLQEAIHTRDAFTIRHKCVERVDTTVYCSTPLSQLPPPTSVSYGNLLCAYFTSVNPEVHSYRSKKEKHETACTFIVKRGDVSLKIDTNVPQDLRS